MTTSNLVNIEAEQSVIGGLMLQAKAWWKVCEIVKADDFESQIHKQYFETIAEILTNGGQADFITVMDALEAKGLDAQQSYLAELADNTPSAASIAQHARIVSSMAKRRALCDYSAEVATMVHESLDKPVEEVIDAAQSIFAGMNEAEQGRKTQKANEVMAEVIKNIEERLEQGGGITGLKTGFSDLDSMINGLQKGSLNVIAARPSMGKTTLACNMVENLAIKDNKRVMFFSLEMTAASLMERMLSSVQAIEHRSLMKADMTQADFSKMTNFVSRMNSSRLLIDDSCLLNLNQIKARVNIEHRKEPIDLIVVDHLTEMSVPTGTKARHEGVADNVRGLKAIAKTLDIPVLLLAQLNRETSHRGNCQPQLTDLGSSGAIEQVADTVMMLHNEGYYEADKNYSDITELLVRKNRNGEQGVVGLASQLRYLRFLSASADDYAGYKEASEKQSKNDF